MYCIYCGKQVDEDSVFCQFCGKKIAHTTSELQSDNSLNEVSTKEEPTPKNKAEVIWNKFSESYNAEDGEREKFNALSSEYIWELVERLATNAFETFIEEKKSELNNQPYKVIEALKNHYLYAVTAGYRLWLAEAIVNNDKLNKFKSFDLDDFIKEWKNTDFSFLMKNIPSELELCISTYRDNRMESFLDNHSTIKDVSAVTINELKEITLMQILNGYFAGIIEARFRK